MTILSYNKMKYEKETINSNGEKNKRKENAWMKNIWPLSKLFLDFINFNCYIKGQISQKPVSSFLFSKIGKEPKKDIMKSSYQLYRSNN